MKKTLTKVLFAITAIAVLTLPSYAAVTINKGNGVIISMENDAMKLDIAVEGGGRISKLIDKKAGKNIVTSWDGPGADGGLLDDRNVFTAMAYQASVQQPGGKIGQVRLTAEAPNGMSMLKIITLRDDSPKLEVSETFSNGSQKPARLMLRSFMLPDGEPRTDATQYFVPLMRIMLIYLLRGRQSGTARVEMALSWQRPALRNSISGRAAQSVPPTNGYIPRLQRGNLYRSTIQLR
jgi:hypothetical protein